MLNRIFVVDSVTLSSTGTAVSSYVPWDQTTRKLPTQVVVKATGQGAYVRLSNDNSAATNVDVLVQGGDHVVLSVQGRRWVSVLSDGASSTVSVGALSTGVSGDAASLNLNFVSDGTLDPRITFTRASTATFFNSAGVLTSAATNAPRFDYNPSTLAAQGLLIEEARTNLATYSEQFDNVAGWTPTRSSVSANATTAPTGTNVADKLVEDTTASNTHYDQTAVITPTAATSYTFSAYFKASERTQCGIGLTGAGNSDSIVVFNLSTGAYVATVGAAPSSYSITPAGSGWYRCSITWVTTSTAAMAGRVYTANASTITYTGDGTSGLFIWGAQLEAGAFPTSYIPTTTTALTRSADVASVNTLSPWYNASASTLYTEFTTPVPTSVNNSAVVVGFDDGTANNRFSNFYVSNTGAVSAIQTIAGVQSFTITGASGLTLSNIQKGAASYQAGSYAMSVNGAPPVADAFASAPPTVNTMRIGLRPSGTQANMYLRRIVYYPRRLTDLELRQITLPTGATITTQDYSFDSNFTGNTVAIGS